jgi:hypothetical protein
MKKYDFEIRQIDAWGNISDCYEYNETWHICNLSSAAQDEKRLFLRALRRRGISFKRGAVRVDYDGSVYEIVNRKTLEPLFCMIPSY